MQAAFIPALRISQRLSKPFWPPALASQAPPAIMLAEAPIGLVVAFLDVEHRIIVLDYLFSSPLTIVCAIVGVVAVGLLTGWLGHRLGLGA